MIRLTRTIEYEYDSAEDMAKDIASWTLRGTGRTWFPFNPSKRARSRITAIEDVSGDGPGTIVPREVADALDTSKHPDPQAQRIRDLSHALRELLDAIGKVSVPDDQDPEALAVLDGVIDEARLSVEVFGVRS